MPWPPERSRPALESARDIGPVTAHPVTNQVLAGARLALATLTVVPIRAAMATTVDRTVGGIAMTLAPAVGLLLGLVAATVGLGLAGLGVPVLVIVALVVVLVVGQWLRDYRAGRELYAIGSNPDGARLAGVRSDRRVLTAFVLSEEASFVNGATLDVNGGSRMG